LRSFNPQSSKQWVIQPVVAISQARPAGVPQVVIDANALTAEIQITKLSLMFFMFIPYKAP
jgi:hypothetical protein